MPQKISVIITYPWLATLLAPRCVLMNYGLATIFNLIKHNCIHSNFYGFMVFKIKLGYKVHTYCKQDCIQIFFCSKFGLI